MAVITRGWYELEQGRFENVGYSGMLIRAAEPQDAMEVARVHVRSWQVAYRGLLPEAYLNQLLPEDRAARYEFASGDPLKPQTMVALEGFVIRGFATIAPARDEDLQGYGELCALYLDPGWWSRGLGVALITAARARLFEMGFRTACLWLLVGNTRAGRFYEMDGWKPDGLRRTADVWGVTVEEIRYVSGIEAGD
jgi:GNAT superfamily N-acetyltransferase